MIHMDIDIHSPRRQRTMCVKRTRSPEPSSPQDRPSKRLSLNVGHPNPYPSLNIRKRLSDHSAGSSRHSSEDWVRQTGDLTIDSPICLGSFFQPDKEGIHGETKDEDTLMEMPDFNRQETISGHAERPRLPLLQTTGYPSPRTFSEVHPHSNATQNQRQLSIPSITVNPSGYTSFQATSILLVSEDPQPARSLLNPSPIAAPSINVVPPTPMEQQTPLDYQQANSSLVMNSSTTSSINVSPSSPRSMTPRKQPRFMMGPRVDCEKCRLGVKGHFVHLD